MLQVVLTLAPGGTERLVVELVKRLGAESAQAVCCLDVAGAWGQQLQLDGVPLTVIGRQPGFHPGLGSRIAAAAAAVHATVLHCHQYTPFVYGALARLRRPGLRVVFTEHGRLSDAPPSSKRRMVNPWLTRAASRIVSVSANLREHMVQEGFPAGRVEVVHNGIDPGPPPSIEDRARARQDLGVGHETIVIGTVARLDPVKDYGTLLAALAHPSLAATDRRLVVIGDGPERQRLESRAKELGVADRATFLGHRDDARRWLAGVDIYVNSSISEGVSLTILEAMAAGLPVVATEVGGTPEVVTPECGELVPARDAAAIAAAVARLAADSERRRVLGRQARERVARQFTIERMVNTYLDMYRGAH